MHTSNHFIPGLRFDSGWKYQTLTPSGHAHWAHLPLSTDRPDSADPTGAWWCSRRCAAVLLRRPWQAMCMPCGLPAQPSADEVAQTLGALLPGWQVALPAHAAQAPVMPCARALDQGGGALLLLHPDPGDGRVQRPCWAWVVGMERQQRLQRAACGTAAGAVARPWWPTGMRPYPRALLAVPFGWAMPCSSGYAARVRMHGPGQCHVDGIYGQRSTNLCLATITLVPPGASHLDPSHAASTIARPPSKEAD